MTTPSEAQNVIAEVVRAHPQADEYGYPVEECRCGATFSGDYADHLASEVDKALGGLTREYAIRNHVYDDTAMLGDLDDLIGEVDLFSADHRIEERWVSGWSEA